MSISDLLHNVLSVLPRVYRTQGIECPILCHYALIAAFIDLVYSMKIIIMQIEEEKNPTTL